ncbi:MAG: HPF/RaiA family ribosome-associated protein [Planctomycetota bacterium]|nr:HPF/RaiA family ribosome-associated protein [Planctomycetota bacterium]
MQVNLHLKNVKDTPAFQSLILKRITSSLRQFTSLIQSVDVHVEDEKEDSGEFCGNCRIQLQPSRGKAIHIAAKADSPSGVISVAVHKLKHAVSNMLDRQNNSKNIRHHLARM